MEDPVETPYLHHPDTLDDKKENGLICFFEQSRNCGADCMAFQTLTPDGPDYRGQQWANCMLLVNLHRVGKHLTILAQGVDGFLRRSRAEAADQARIAQNPPASPR